MRQTSPLILAAAVLAALLLAAPGSARAAEPQMHFDRAMAVQPVCLPVTDPRGQPRLLYGRRFTDGPTSTLTPAIVLVHGIASSTDTWDFTPTWSVARALAAAGYVVYAYDRLGYARSSYFDVPGGGQTLTTQQHRRNLHEVVTDVKTGGYSTTSAADCSGPATPGGMRNPTVAILGHSAGGWVVAGYPGEYHDVAAMIQTDILGSTARSGQQSGGSKGGGFTPDPAHPDYFKFFQTQADCEAFNTYPPGIVRSVVDVACRPPFLDSPFGEITGLAAMAAQNDVDIRAIGPGTAVLLASGDHDTTAPEPDAKADFQYYKDNCGCDVTQLIIPDTAHLFMAHRSLASTLDFTVRWLAAHGLPGRAGAPGVPSTGAGGVAGTPRARTTLRARVSPSRDRRRPYRFTVAGRVVPAAGAPAAACAGGRVAVRVRARHRTLATRRVRLGASCSFRTRLTVPRRARLGHAGRLRFPVAFGGTRTLRPSSARPLRARAGR